MSPAVQVTLLEGLHLGQWLQDHPDQNNEERAMFHIHRLIAENAVMLETDRLKRRAAWRRRLNLSS